MKMIITYLAGFISASVLLLNWINGEIISGLIISVPITIFAFIFVHKIHKKKQKEYYNRFKSHPYTAK